VTIIGSFYETPIFQNLADSVSQPTPAAFPHIISV
jgi:hypothetical protein